MSEFFAQYGNLLLVNTWITVYVTTLATIFAYLLGVPMGVLLVITRPHGIWPHRSLNAVLEWIVNVGRSIPFIILLVALIPFTTGCRVGGLWGYDDDSGSNIGGTTATVAALRVPICTPSS